MKSPRLEHQEVRYPLPPARISDRRLRFLMFPSELVLRMAPMGVRFPFSSLVVTAGRCAMSMRRICVYLSFRPCMANGDAGRYMDAAHHLSIPG